MEWTREQRETIETTGKNILVSAAAGSGKTTVLVERIKNLVLNEGADIDRFLITTFTKAAAAEMKDRLEKAIRSEMKKDGADRAYLTRQLQLLPEATIGTFHSFAIDIIRQYFYLTDLEPGFTVADEIQTSMMRREALDRVFERRYEENFDEFSSFLLKYSSDKGDGRLKDSILATHRTLVSIPDYISWARNKAELLNAEDPLAKFGGYSVAGRMLLDYLEDAADSYNEAARIADEMSLPTVGKTAADDAAAITAILNSARAAMRGSEEEIRDEIIRAVDDVVDFAPGKMQYAKDKADEDTRGRITKIRSAGKSKTDKIKSSFSPEKFEIYIEDTRSVYEETLYYIGILEEFVDTFRALKNSENLIDFDDIMHYAIEILGSDEASEELKAKYDYIFVDEYQDSNNLQEVIVGRIAREDNLFMVGDVKQCIYKFRLAEPELFNAKARLYDREDENNSILLNLNSNFRSKSNITESVNKVFEQVMEGYDDRAKLHCTAPEEYPGFEPRLHMIIREAFDEDAPEKTDAEAALAARIIRERLGHEIYDGKQGCMRPLTYRDFAIITRKNRVVEEVERYLINEGIPAYGEGSGRYFETVEIQVFINILRIIDNMRQDIPLISAMRSAVFGFRTDELAEIRIGHREGTFYSAVMEYAENGDREELREKVRSMIETVNLWKEIGRTVPLEELMKIVLYDTGYYDYCSGLPVGAQRISNLRLIGEKAAHYEQISHGGLYGFLKYIESMESGGQNDSEAKIIGENEDVVRVMSVHKSKGLEFPVVIFPDAARKTSSPAGRDSITIHTDFGIGLPVVNREEHWHRKTFLQKAIDFTKEKEVIKEEIRILYVALTRAKDGLDIIGTFKTEDEIPERVSDSRFIDMMYMPLKDMDITEEITYTNAEELEQEHIARMHTVDRLYDEAARAKATPPDEEDDLICRRLDFAYPYEDSAVRPKYSVSQLNDHEEVVDVPLASFEKEGVQMAISAAREGTLMHLLMERTDFARVAGSETGGLRRTTDILRETADRLLAEETITAQEYDTMDLSRAAAFFETETGRRVVAAAEARRLFKEKEFILEKEINGELTVVQGIIDCYFEESDRLILIDYKNSCMGGGRTIEEIAERYAGQIELYREALEKATGKEVAEAYLYLFSTGTFIHM